MLLPLGQLALWIALLLAALAALLFSLAAIRRDELSAQAARDSLIGSAAALAVSAGSLVAALVTCDFRFQYVSHYGDQGLPLAYRLSAFWAGAEGSLLLWTLMMAFVAAGWAAAHRSLDRKHAVAGAILGAIAAFFLVLLNVASTPFTPAWPVPVEGDSLKLALRTWAMIAHPPILFAGYALLIVPLAVALANLITGRLDARLATLRQFLLLGWTCLTAGIVLGSWWAYTDLGFGGYWAWDPVENASLIPWLVATAALHALRPAGEGPRANSSPPLLRTALALAVLAFLSCVLATYITRGGAVESLHAYAASPLASSYLYFMATVVVVLIALLVARRPGAGRTTAAIPANPLRGSSLLLLIAAILLAAFAVAVLLGTVGPPLVTRWTGQLCGLQIPEFNRLGAVFGVLILGGLVIGQAWLYRRRPLAALRGRGPALAAHLAFVIMAVALASSAPSAKDQPTTDRTVALARGETLEFAGHRIRFAGLSHRMSPDGREMTVEAELPLLDDGPSAATLRPGRTYDLGSRDERAEVAIRTGWLEDLYVSLNAYQAKTGGASLTFHRAPLMLWLWIGGGLLTLAGLAAALGLGRRSRGGDPC